MNTENKNNIVIYEDKKGNVELRADIEKDTIWATQEQIGKLFECERSVITKHIRNIIKDQELQEKSICANFAHMGTSGQRYNVKCYNLDAINRPRLESTPEKLVGLYETIAFLESKSLNGKLKGKITLKLTEELEPS